MEVLEQSRLISHTISCTTVASTIAKITKKIKQQGDKSYITVAEQLEILKELSSFDFGCYLLQNQGINGYWTHYMLTHPWFGRKTRKNNLGKSLIDIESFLLDRAPTMLATQQRFEIFLQENQKQVKNNASLASIPCGMLGELLYLNYANIDTINLVGIDYDANTLNYAQILAGHQGLTKFLQLHQQDAWELNLQEKFDLISSNGLNIYESNDEKIKALYRGFYQALKIGGKLVTSFLTYPPHLTNNCEWEISQINQNDLMQQKIIFSDIIDAKWQCYQSSAQMQAQLSTAGFTEINFIYDRAKMFPTVVATKNACRSFVPAS